MKKLIEFALKIGNLKNVPRTGWTVAGIKNPESVADHTWRLAVLCMIVGDKLKLNAEKLLKMAIIDDIAESIVGDLVIERGDKQLMSAEEKYRLEKKAIGEIFDALEDGNEYIALWEESQAGKTSEAKVLKQLDKLEMVIQAYEYEGQVKSENLDEFWVKARRKISDPDLMIVLDELEELRKAKKS